MLVVVTAVEPWKASIAVAPASVYVAPNSTVAGLEPLIVITGGTLSLYPSSVKLFIRANPPTAISAFWIALNSATTSEILVLKALFEEGL